jgi:hypothetical protein
MKYFYFKGNKMQTENSFVNKKTRTLYLYL